MDEPHEREQTHYHDNEGKVFPMADISTYIQYFCFQPRAHLVVGLGLLRIT